MNYKNKILQIYFKKKVLKLPYTYYLKENYKIPYQIDIKHLIYDYNYRKIITNSFIDIIFKKKLEFDFIVGIATGGILFATGIANKL